MLRSQVKWFYASGILNKKQQKRRKEGFLHRWHQIENLIYEKFTSGLRGKKLLPWVTAVSQIDDKFLDTRHLIFEGSLEMKAANEQKRERLLEL